MSTGQPPASASSFGSTTGAPASPPLRRAAIIGAGPVGLALGLMMARHCPDWSVSLFDARALHADVSADPRTLALSLGSLQMLQPLGGWPETGTQPILEVQVTQETPALARSGQRPQVRMSARELGVPQLGAVLAYGQLVPTLHRAWLGAAEQQAHRLHHRFGQAVQGLKIVDGAQGHAQVEVDAGICESFDLTIVAEGGVFMRDRSPKELAITSARRGTPAAPTPAESSKVLDWLQARSISHDYGQTAWVGTVMLSGATPGRAIEHFSRQGPVARLPLPPSTGATASPLQRASLVWCVKADEDPVTGLDEAGRMAVLNSLLPEGAGRIEHIGPLKSFALGLQAQASLVREACLVRIGNAAQTLHPVAGQGLNLGLRDAAALIERLRLMERRGESLEQALAGVQWSRAADRWSMIAATDFLARSFTWQLPGAATLRALGLMAVEHLPGLKPSLARQMMFGRR